MTRRDQQRRRGRYFETPLERLLVARGIPPSQVDARLRHRMGDKAPAEILQRRWRLGRAEPRRKNMVRLLWAVREATGDPSIRMEDIIDLDPENPDNWTD